MGFGLDLTCIFGYDSWFIPGVPGGGSLPSCALNGWNVGQPTAKSQRLGKEQTKGQSGVAGRQKTGHGGTIGTAMGLKRDQAAATRGTQRMRSARRAAMRPR